MAYKVDREEFCRIWVFKEIEKETPTAPKLKGSKKERRRALKHDTFNASDEEDQVGSIRIV